MLATAVSHASPLLRAWTSKLYFPGPIRRYRAQRALVTLQSASYPTRRYRNSILLGFARSVALKKNVSSDCSAPRSTTDPVIACSDLISSDIVQPTSSAFGGDWSTCSATSVVCANPFVVTNHKIPSRVIVEAGIDGLPHSLDLIPSSRPNKTNGMRSWRPSASVCRSFRKTRTTPREVPSHICPSLSSIAVFTYALGRPLTS